MGFGDTLTTRLETARSDDAPSTDGADDCGLSRDDIFHILQTKRRRDVLRYLHGRDGPVEMRDLAEQVAAWEQETTVDALTSSERQRVYISLYQSHLPKLDGEGVIEYRKDRGLVERTPVAAEFDPYVIAESDPESTPDRWPHRYALIALFGSIVVLTTALEAVPLSGLAAATTVLIAFSLLTAAHAASRSA